MAPTETAASACCSRLPFWRPVLLSLGTVCLVPRGQVPASAGLSNSVAAGVRDEPAALPGSC